MKCRTCSIALAGLVVAIFSSGLRADDAKPNGDAVAKGPIRQELLAKFDKNGNGKLDANEKAAAKAELAKQKAKGGKDAGMLTADALLKKYDINGDGKLDTTELATMIKDLQARREAHKKKATT